MREIMKEKQTRDQVFSGFVFINIYLINLKEKILNFTNNFIIQGIITENMTITQ